jgi:hypothetical protein
MPSFRLVTIPNPIPRQALGLQGQMEEKMTDTVTFGQV